jgi:hypothetical protein
MKQYRDVDQVHTYIHTYIHTWYSTAQQMHNRHTFIITQNVTKYCSLILSINQINQKIDVEFEVLTKAVMKISIFWNITPCSPSKVNRRFGGTYRLHLSGPKNKPRNKPTWSYLAACFTLVSCLVYPSTLKDGGDMFLRNVGWLWTDYTSLYPRRRNSSENWC